MEKKHPIRSCIACRTRKEQKEMLRVGFNKAENKIYLGNGNGRGIYLCYNKSCFDLAVKKKNIFRALKCDEKIIDMELILSAIWHNQN